MLTPLVSGENPPPRSLMAVLFAFCEDQAAGGKELFGALILFMRALPS